jgi:hypothetical protein
MRNPDREDAAVEDRFVETAERAMRALKSWNEEIKRRLDLDYADERPSESDGNGSVLVEVEDGDEDRGWWMWGFLKVLSEKFCDCLGELEFFGCENWGVSPTWVVSCKTKTKTETKAKAKGGEETNALIGLCSQYSIDICEHEYIRISVNIY